MIKFLKEKLKSRQDLLLLKKYTEPSKEFLSESYGVFISELKKSGIIKESADVRLFNFSKAFGYSFALLFVLLSFTGGIVVYAQKQNVDSNHPLYSMKRLGENIQVKLTPAEKKPALQDEFAQRRLEEIKQLVSEKEDKINLINSEKTEEVKRIIEKIDQKTNQTTTEDSETVKQAQEQKKHAIERVEEERKKEIEDEERKNEMKTEELNDDFHKTVDSVLKTIEPSKRESRNRERSKDLCESLREKIKEHEEVLRENEQWPDFEDKCDGEKKDD